MNNSYWHQAITWTNVDPYPATAFPYEKPPAPPTSHDDVIKWNIFRVTGHLCGEFIE